MDSPKVFISYSWTTPDHEAWVLELATRLTDSGVTVALDKWDLREGQDKFQFMESMVTDPAIKKVLVICDRAYATKADQRRGGVGTESQIISKEVYESTSQTKFVPIVAEVDERGEAYLPTYMSGRIYIDMSDPVDRYKNFEQLVRWIYDKPTHERPPLGKPPIYITQPEKPHLGTASRHRLAVDAIRDERRTAIPALQDYLETFSVGLEELRIAASGDTPIDDLVVASIDTFKLYRDECIDLISVVARNRTDDEAYQQIHRFLESVLAYKYPPEGTRARNNRHVDNYVFFAYETYLYVAATLIRHRRFGQLCMLMEQPYYIGHDPRPMRTYVDFRDPVRALEDRNTRLGLRRLSLIADVVKNRATRNDLTFEQIMQAEFVLFLRSVLHDTGGRWWFPNSLLYSLNHGPFELFVRGTSRSFFNSTLRILLGVETKEELQKRFIAKSHGIAFGSLWDFQGFDPMSLMNFEQLSTIP